MIFRQIVHDDLIDAVPDGLDPDRPIAAICMSGQRSAVAASLLKRHGARDVLHVADGGVGPGGAPAIRSSSAAARYATSRNSCSSATSASRRRCFIRACSRHTRLSETPSTSPISLSVRFFT